MTAVRNKTRYVPADLDTYLEVLQATETASCFEGLPTDPALFKVACLHAAYSVPLNDPPRGAFNVDAYVRTRLQEALYIRNRYYRDHLEPERRLQ